MAHRPLIIATLAGLSLTPIASAQSAAFTGLGVFSASPVTSPNSHATGVSADGTVITGYARGEDPTTLLTVTVALYRTTTVTWQTIANTGYSQANGVSSNGSTIVGTGPLNISTGSFGPFVFHPGTAATFPSITSGRFFATSSNGGVVVGGAGPDAIRWTSAAGAQTLPHIAGWNGTGAIATAVSADGTTIVGTDTSGAGPQGFIWDAANGTRGLGFLNSSAQFSQALGISADGSTVVGVSNNDAGIRQGFVYRIAGGIRPLAMLDNSQGGAALAASADGSVIVGQAVVGSSTIAYYWDRVRGRRDLAQFLTTLGAAGLNGWTLTSANAISPDGTFIVGDGIDPQGRTQAWRARIPAFCYANCDLSTTPPILNVADMVCFINRFASADSYANCDNSSTAPALNVGDFVCFQAAFANGCH